ncbi:hypothetical protein A3H16_01815 [Candidatus Kaiserbacteria bacterium RIFCSPLOWO2_12_FULL_53_8]|uniref:Asparaginase n=1 Tax=Candidatus Kaiserbacteria bacterium RIFCSPLOWO2_12_FULL_53_8 TaxID=1798529 RepID=A0A1F6G184_9BACT|nr:MAG: hypothetical protein A3H16_01815 [Candidatus Kaiserbacteria bacterium RIFCSPLOWO2_12_FULL_53_8]
MVKKLKKVVRKTRAQKPRILILGCGGTIAMVPDRKGVLRAAKTIKQLLHMVPTLRKHATFDFKQLSNVDSSDLNPSDWTKFAFEAANAVESGKYQAILFAHGTDTMAYSATAVSFVLGERLNIPVAFTGSQLPMVKFGTDARFNIENTVLVLTEAIKQRIAEVMVVFYDVVLRASRSIKISEAAFAAFGSPAFPPLAGLSATGVTFRPEARRASKAPFRAEDCDFHFNADVVVLDLVPGFKPGILFDIIHSGKCKALVLRSLGAGNVPSRDEFSLIPCIKEATQLKIPVVITTKFVGGTTHAGTYGPGRAALDAGAIESGDLNDVAVHVKVAFLLAQGVRPTTLQRRLLAPLAGEVSA